MEVQNRIIGRRISIMSSGLLGCVLIELFSLRPIWPSDVSTFSIIFKVGGGECPSLEGVPENMLPLCKQCLDSESINRPRAEKVLAFLLDLWA